uniref:F-box domain-containing protein n=1 Tax=Chromera velia CCMP2878 TaxID=1169474 RepID=A0A0G4GU24_9ALVE|eukprot:Cvel_23379.t1-p1 / transcript=Cvel_23379.t1 / gene=Cvel_23379 / organism=Chromera_velia_CCMP2878 / gene_product=hypothetical protein / transcript_product=hypothetical protein / location=Cvel_scaffold2402:8915-15529(+) / protein_length=1198 / sequence_SO=supercontig / SO=protein_coding / is_pseudo=false
MTDSLPAPLQLGEEEEEADLSIMSLPPDCFRTSLHFLSLRDLIRFRQTSKVIAGEINAVNAEPGGEFHLLDSSLTELRAPAALIFRALRLTGLRFASVALDSVPHLDCSSVGESTSRSSSASPARFTPWNKNMSVSPGTSPAVSRASLGAELLSAGGPSSSMDIQDSLAQLPRLSSAAVRTPGKSSTGSALLPPLDDPPVGGLSPSPSPTRLSPTPSSGVGSFLSPNLPTSMRPPNARDSRALSLETELLLFLKRNEETLTVLRCPLQILESLLSVPVESSGTASASASVPRAIVQGRGRSMPNIPSIVAEETDAEVRAQRLDDSGEGATASASSAHGGEVQPTESGTERHVPISASAVTRNPLEGGVEEREGLKVTFGVEEREGLKVTFTPAEGKPPRGVSDGVLLKQKERDGGAWEGEEGDESPDGALRKIASEESQQTMTEGEAGSQSGDRLEKESPASIPTGPSLSLPNLSVLDLLADFPLQTPHLALIPAAFPNLEALRARVCFLPSPSPQGAQREREQPARENTVIGVGERGGRYVAVPAGSPAGSPVVRSSRVGQGDVGAPPAEEAENPLAPLQRLKVVAVHGAWDDALTFLQMLPVSVEHLSLSVSASKHSVSECLQAAASLGLQQPPLQSAAPLCVLLQATGRFLRLNTLRLSLHIRSSVGGYRKFWTSSEMDLALISAFSAIQEGRTGAGAGSRSAGGLFLWGESGSRIIAPSFFMSRPNSSSEPPSPDGPRGDRDTLGRMPQTLKVLAIRVTSEPKVGEIFKSPFGAQSARYLAERIPRLREVVLDFMSPEEESFIAPTPTPGAERTNGILFVSLSPHAHDRTGSGTSLAQAAAALQGIPSRPHFNTPAHGFAEAAAAMANYQSPHHALRAAAAAAAARNRASGRRSQSLLTARSSGTGAFLSDAAPVVPSSDAPVVPTSSDTGSEQSPTQVTPMATEDRGAASTQFLSPQIPPRQVSRQGLPHPNSLIVPSTSETAISSPGLRRRLLLQQQQQQVDEGPPLLHQRSEDIPHRSSLTGRTVDHATQGSVLRSPTGSPLPMPSPLSTRLLQHQQDQNQHNWTHTQRPSTTRPLELPFPVASPTSLAAALARVEPSTPQSSLSSSSPHRIRLPGAAGADAPGFATAAHARQNRGAPEGVTILTLRGVHVWTTGSWVQLRHLCGLGEVEPGARRFEALEFPVVLRRSRIS